MRLWQVTEWEYCDGPAKGLLTTIQSHKGNLWVRMQGLHQQVTVQEGVWKSSDLLHMHKLQHEKTSKREKKETWLFQTHMVTRHTCTGGKKEKGDKKELPGSNPNHSFIRNFLHRRGWFIPLCLVVRWTTQVASIVAKPSQNVHSCWLALSLDWAEFDQCPHVIFSSGLGGGLGLVYTNIQENISRELGLYWLCLDPQVPQSGK